MEPISNNYNLFDKAKEAIKQSHKMANFADLYLKNISKVEENIYFIVFIVFLCLIPCFS